MGPNCLEFKNISIDFDDVRILTDISFSVCSGEMKAIIGQNGAGKTTLFRTLSGELKADRGEILLNGKCIEPSRLPERINTDICFINNDIQLSNDLRVYEHLFLGRPNNTGSGKIILPSRKKLISQAYKVLNLLGCGIDATTQVGSLSFGEKRLVQLAKAYIDRPRFLILDEITSSFNYFEASKILNILASLRKQGTGILFFTHKVLEVINNFDEVIFLRNGRIAETANCSDLPYDDLLKKIFGKVINHRFPKLPVKTGDVILKIDHLSTDYLNNINFTLREGEIIGITGPTGSGRSSLMQAIAGDRKIKKGKISFFRSEEDYNIESDCSIIPQYQRCNGLFDSLNIAQNITISNLNKVVKKNFLSENSENIYARDLIDRLNIKGNFSQPVNTLSGGNKQKVILARAIFANSKVLLLDEPTRSVDIAGRVAMYNIMNEFVQKKRGIIIASSDFSELIGMCDKIIILNNGQLLTEINQKDVTEDLLYRYVNNQ